MRPVESEASDKSSFSTDPEVWTHWLTGEYRGKWGCDNAAALSEAAALIEESDGLSLDITPSEAQHGCSRIRKHTSCDINGVCVGSLWCLAASQPERFCLFLNAIAASRDLLQMFHITGSIRAKRKGVVTAKQTRVLLPLPSVLQVLEYIS